MFGLNFIYDYDDILQLEEVTYHCSFIFIVYGSENSYKLLKSVKKLNGVVKYLMKVMHWSVIFVNSMEYLNLYLK